MSSKSYLTLAVVVIALALVSIIIFQLAARPALAPQNGKLRVAASFYPIYFFASRIAGNKAEVYDITPSGTEPHDYEPTAREIAGIEQSSLLVLNGGNIETWGNKIRDELAGGGTRIVVAGDGLFGRISIDGKVSEDPHVWLSPALAEKEASNILEGFVAADPVNADYYRANASLLQNQLENLNAEFASGLNSCARREFISSHAAFGYLADQYNLRQISIAGISPDEEPSTAKLAEIAKLVKQTGMKYIFYEKLVNSRLAETIAGETGAGTLVLDPIEGISDSDIKAGKNYFTQMEENLRNLELVLNCAS